MKGGDNKMEDETEITVKDEKAEKAEKADQLDESDKRVECVFLLDNGKVRLVPVKTGIQDNSYIEIKAGLKVGDQVVSSPYSAIAKFLKDGDPVKVVPKEQLFNKRTDADPERIKTGCYLYTRFLCPHSCTSRPRRRYVPRPSAATASSWRCGKL